MTKRDQHTNDPALGHADRDDDRAMLALMMLMIMIMMLMMVVVMIDNYFLKSLKVVIFLFFYQLQTE